MVLVMIALLFPFHHLLARDEDESSIPSRVPIDRSKLKLAQGLVVV